MKEVMSMPGDYVLPTTNMQSAGSRAWAAKGSAAGRAGDGLGKVADNQIQREAMMGDMWEGFFLFWHGLVPFIIDWLWGDQA